MSGAAHGEITLGGPGIPVLALLLALAMAGAVFVLVDAVRRRGGFRGPLRVITWVTPQVLYLVALVVGLVTKGGNGVAAVVGILWLVAAPVQVAYLLRVVFPSRKCRDASRASEDPSMAPRGDTTGPDL